MDYTSLIGPAVVAAGVSGVVSIVGLITSNRTARDIHREKLDFDRKLTEQKFEFDKNLAERKFEYDREFHDHKRRVELAETILSEFLQMNDVIQAARSPFAFGGEADGRTRNEGETEEEARQRDSYYVPLARLMKHSEFVSGLMSKRYRSRAVLGDQIDRAFQEIREVILRVQTSSSTLMRTVGARRPDEALITRCEADIWAGLPEEDQLQPKVNQAIEIVEAVSRPILERGRTQ